MSEITKEVGELIRQARKRKGLTQKELGEKLGITESGVNKYENGTRNLSLETLSKIADAIGVQFKVLLGQD